jgi:hypothetical protein
MVTVRALSVVAMSGLSKVGSAAINKGMRMQELAESISKKSSLVERSTAPTPTLVFIFGQRFL